MAAATLKHPEQGAREGAEFIKRHIGGAGALGDAARVTRVPSGHPEGYLEGFATIYAEAARAIRASQAGKAPDPAVIFPTVEDGLAGVKFIEAAVSLSASNGTWVRIT